MIGIESTIGGIEAIHSWVPPGASEPAIELGRILDEDGDRVWPRFQLVGIVGLGALGEPETNFDRPPGRPIEVHRRSERRGKTLVYTGTIKARTLDQLRVAEAQLRAAFVETAKGRMNVSWHPLDTRWAEVPPKFYEAVPLTVEVADVQEGQTWDRSFVIGLRMLDARYWDGEEETETIAVTKTETPASASFDFPSIVKGPVLTLALPASADPVDVTVTNTTSVKSLTVNVPPAWSGEVLTFDFGARTITDETGADRSELLDPEDLSLWTTAPLMAGSNTLEVQARNVVLTSTKAPGKIEDATGIGTVAWVSPEEAKALGGTGTVVQVSETAVSHYLKSKIFEFAIPTAAEVLGITAGVYCDGGGNADNSVRIVKGGAVKTTVDRARPIEKWDISKKILREWGGSSDLWGQSWTPADINSTEFGFALSAKGTHPEAVFGEVDGVTMTVTYRPTTPVACAASVTFDWTGGYH